MPAPARAQLESLLRHRNLDRTLLPSWSRDHIEETSRVPTAIAALDRLLNGGFPRGQLSEIVGARSTGRLAILLSTCAAATMRGELVALIDPLDMFDPPTASAAGIDLSRLLWIRGETASPARCSLACEYGALQKAVDRAVKSLNLVLQAGGFGLAVLDCAELAPRGLKQLPFTTWLRFQRVIEGSETACLLVGSEPIARSSSGLTLTLEHAPCQDDVHRSPREASVHARVLHARAIRTERDVRLHLSAAAS
jgi:hypothetical protein